MPERSPVIGKCWQPRREARHFRVRAFPPATHAIPFGKGIDVHDARLEKFLFRPLPKELDRLARNAREPEIAPPGLPPPKGPSSQPWGGWSRPNNPAPMLGILPTFVVFVIILSLIAYGITAWDRKVAHTWVQLERQQIMMMMRGTAVELGRTASTQNDVADGIMAAFRGVR